MNNIDLGRRKKYIAGGAAAMAAAIAVCGLGTYRSNEVSIYKENVEYLSENTSDAWDVEGSDDVNNGNEDKTEPVTSDELISQLSDSITIEEKDVYKDETVYVFSDASGKTNKILVNEHLKNSGGEAELKDKTNLKEIVNLKGDEEFLLSGDTITWKADGNDIYYQGTSDEELPVQVKATYYLDGKEISPNELAGKSGKVKIRFDYTNNAVVTKNINGKNEEINVPFVAVTGMILGDNFKNITVENGKTMAEGGANIVVGYAMPGLMDSLNAEEKDFSGELSVPEFFEVNADVTDFSLDMTITMVVNGSEMKLDGGIDLAEFDGIVESLSDAGIQLADGSGELADGVDTLLSKMGEFNTGVGALKNALDTLSSGSGTLAQGVTTINSSAHSICNGITALDNALNTPMTEEEKQAVSDSATAMVQTQFTEGTDTYNYIYSEAANAFSASMTSEETIGAIYSGLYANLHDTLYNAAVAQYAQQSGSSVEEAAAAIGGEIEAQIQSQLYELASGIASGIAAQGADAMGQNVVSACCQSASQAAGQGAITGAESVKTEIAAQIETVQDTGYSLVTGASALASGTDTFAASVPQLTDGIAQIVSGAGTLTDGSTQLTLGVSQLSDGASALNDGINQFNSEAISTIVSAYNGDVKALVSRIQAVIEASAEYDTYTMLDEDDAGTTKFIIKTEGISVSE